MKKKNRFALGITLVVAATFFSVIAACSKGGDDNAVGSGPGITGSGNGGGGRLTATVATGPMTKGSVIVNGVRYEDAAADIIADDTPKTAVFLDNGMTVKVKGTVNADGVTGTAEKVEVVSEVRGAVAAKGADTVTVNGQTVLVDGGTVLANVASFATLTTDDTIEVHGGRDDAGIIHATRVEKLPAGGAAQSEVRGVVGGKTAATFTVGGLTITFDAATPVLPDGAAFLDGDIVEVRLNGSAATRIAVEHLNHPEFEPSQGQKISVEGMLAGFTSSGVFNVGSTQVQLGANFRIEGGAQADLADGMRVQAEGPATGGVLIAEKIKIKESIRIEANADAAGAAHVLGKTVATTSLTRLSSNLSGTAAIAAGDGLRIRGFVNRDGVTITAVRVDKLSNPVLGSDVVVEGPVSNINAAARTLTILGIPVSPGASLITRPNDDKGVDNTLTMPTADFFAALSEGATVVKAKGAFDGSAFTAAELEIE